MPELHPVFVDRMSALLGNELGDFLRALDEPAALALRANPLREGAAGAALSFADGPVPWADLGYYLKPRARPGAGLWHFCGGFYVQEASAMMPASALGIRPGEKVLDLCAAPGGKSSQIAFALRGEGLLVSNEPEPKRAKMLAGNLERLGIGNAVVTNEYPDRLAEKWPGFFDAVLVDAPCSGEGMFRREPDSRTEWTPNGPEGCAKRQLTILDSAAILLKPGGRMVYSTCTYNSVENEGVAEAFLRAHPEFSLRAFALPGLPAAKNGMLKILPHRVRGDGQFAALFVKSGEGDRPTPKQQSGSVSRRDAKAPDPAALFRQFQKDWGVSLEAYSPMLWGDSLCAAPAGSPDLSGLRVASPGLMLARIAGNRLEPAHQAAMTLRDLPGVTLDDRDALAFVRGEEVLCDGRGYLAARWHGLPLGWGKASDGVLKNHLPKGLRRAIETP